MRLNVPRNPRVLCRCYCLSGEVGPHLIAGGLPVGDPLVTGQSAGDEAVHGIEELLAVGAEAGDGLVSGEVAHGGLRAVIVDGVEELVVALEGV